MTDPADKMRAARRLAAMSLGVDELPNDAEVECALGPDGVLHVSGRVMLKGSLPYVTATVKLVDVEDEDPGTCIDCGAPCELVRPGKSQLTCACGDAPDQTTEET
jgi:hypothetical protein